MENTEEERIQGVRKTLNELVKNKCNEMEREYKYIVSCKDHYIEFLKNEVKEKNDFIEKLQNQLIERLDYENEY